MSEVVNSPPVNLIQHASLESQSMHAPRANLGQLCDTQTPQHHQHRSNSPDPLTVKISSPVLSSPSSTLVPIDPAPGEAAINGRVTHTTSGSHSPAPRRGQSRPGPARPASSTLPEPSPRSNCVGRAAAVPNQPPTSPANRRRPSLTRPPKAHPVGLHQQHSPTLEPDFVGVETQSERRDCPSSCKIYPQPEWPGRPLGRLAILFLSFFAATPATSPPRSKPPWPSAQASIVSLST